MKTEQNNKKTKCKDIEREEDKRDIFFDIINFFYNFDNFICIRINKKVIFNNIITIIRCTMIKTLCNDSSTNSI